MKKNIKLCIGLIRLIYQYIINIGRFKINGFKQYIGKRVKIYICNDGKLSIGQKTWFSDNVNIEISSGSVNIGYNNFFNTNCKIVSLKQIDIGNNNLFGPNTILVDHNHRYEDQNSLICKQGYTTDSIIIGSNIWIGANVVICAGVKIVDHVVVGANSVVTKSILIPGVYVGVPAKIIKKL